MVLSSACLAILYCFDSTNVVQNIERADNFFLQKAFVNSYLTKLNQLIVQNAPKLAIVTGCVVNQRIHLPSEKLRKIRQEIYFIKKFGLVQHLQNMHCQKKNYVKHLYGRINYALLIQPSNKEMQEYKKYLKENFSDKLMGFEI